MFRWGILSTAKIAREQLIPAIGASQNGVVHAIASRDATRARALADQVGAPLSFGSYEELLASDEIDGVYIPLPTSQHVEWTIKAADAGKHVLCEKPISLKTSEIDDLIAARDRNKVVVSEAFMVTYHPQWHKVRDLLASGAIGTLRQVQGAFSYRLLDATNMRNKPELGGGGLPDIGVYPTVTTRFATGKEPLRCSARVRRDETFGTDIWAHWAQQYEGFEASYYISTQMAQRQHMVFHGDLGWIEVLTPFNALVYGDTVVRLHNVDHSEMQEFRFGQANHYQLQCEAFVRRVNGSDDAVFSLEESILNQRVIDAIYRAGDEGGWVEV